jgi:hypothetical protein
MFLFFNNCQKDSRQLTVSLVSFLVVLNESIKGPPGVVRLHPLVNLFESVVPKRFQERSQIQGRDSLSAQEDELELQFGNVLLTAGSN